MPALPHLSSRSLIRMGALSTCLALALPVLAATSAAAADDADTTVVEVVEVVEEQVEPAEVVEEQVEPAEVVEEQVEPAAPVVLEAPVDEPDAELGPATVLEPAPAEQPAAAVEQSAARPQLVAGVRGPNALTAGTGGTWTFSVANTGDRAAAGGLTLRPALPAGVSVVSVSAADGLTCVLGELVCRHDAELPADGSDVAVAVELAFSPAMSGVQPVGVAVTPGAGGADAAGAPDSASMPVTVYDALPEEEPAPAPAPADPAVAAGAPAPAAAPAAVAPAAAAPAAAAPAPRQAVVRPRSSTPSRLAAVSPRPARAAAPAAAPTTTTTTSTTTAATAGVPATLAFTGTRTDAALPAAAALLALGAALLRAGRRRPATR